MEENLTSTLGSGGVSSLEAKAAAPLSSNLCMWEKPPSPSIRHVAIFHQFQSQPPPQTIQLQQNSPHQQHPLNTPIKTR
ncbi:hypothetical protein PGTUg99_003621 [Puccinia graminis f. sp. tritici]|uniref:Uncharacterized protein n=1 Tax=Puccinia graminis f. sp. tritici TaxID=56615 RepID=A0A5B0SBW9_PUCGR|nr:hypothetical protein PGTUg99_003621 [Puccinia graminis f. sp. tritici]